MYNSLMLTINDVEGMFLILFGTQIGLSEATQVEFKLLALIVGITMILLGRKIIRQQYALEPSQGRQ